jgi:benzoyl-CoA reductase/2-hydroxyglutaryl-CoA dehydratase subunit BcrC/BadD/HgdB
METLTYFREIVTTDRRVRELEDFPGKVIGTFCNFVPEELIYAAGAVPVRLCAGDYAAIAVGEEFLPRDLCSVIKSSAGRVRQGEGLYGRADVLVLPTPCDGKKKLGAILAAFKPVHTLQLPPSKNTPAARTFWREQVRQFQQALEGWTGRPIARSALKEAILLLNRRQEVFRRFLRLRQLAPPVISGEDALFVTGASFTDDLHRWIEQTERLCEEVERETGKLGNWETGQSGNSETGQLGNSEIRQPGLISQFPNFPISQFPNSPLRLLLTGAPLIFPNFKLIQLIEATGAVVVADEMCSGTQRLYQPVTLREWSMRAMGEAIAEKYLLPPTCPCFVEGSDRLHRILELVEEFRVDGVIYHNLRLCPLFDIESMAIQQELKRRGLPLLTLHTDYNCEDTGQLRNRIEAFLEIIAER